MSLTKKEAPLISYDALFNNKINMAHSIFFNFVNKILSNYV